MVSVYAVIAGVYASLGNGSDDEGAWKKSYYYKKLYERERGRCRPGIDIDGDGAAEDERIGGVIRLSRD